MTAIFLKYTVVISDNHLTVGAIVMILECSGTYLYNVNSYKLDVL